MARPHRRRLVSLVGCPRGPGTRAGSRRGAEAVELAMVMPVLVLLIVGMMDIGWLFYTESSLDAATNLGCRAGALIDPGVAEGNLAEVQDTTQEGLVAAMSEQGLGNCAEQCEATVSVFGETPGRTLSCVVTYEFRPIIGMTLGSLTLEATQVVRMEWQRR